MYVGVEISLVTVGATTPEVLSFNSKKNMQAELNMGIQVKNSQAEAQERIQITEFYRKTIENGANLKKQCESGKVSPSLAIAYSTTKSIAEGQQIVNQIKASRKQSYDELLYFTHKALAELAAKEKEVQTLKLRLAGAAIPDQSVFDDEEQEQEEQGNVPELLRAPKKKRGRRGNAAFNAVNLFPNIPHPPSPR